MWVLSSGCEGLGSLGQGAQSLAQVVLPHQKSLDCPIVALCFLVLGPKTSLNRNTECQLHSIPWPTGKAAGRWHTIKMTLCMIYHWKIYPLEHKGSLKSCCHCCMVILCLHIHLWKMNESFLNLLPPRSQTKHTEKLLNLFPGKLEISYIRLYFIFLSWDMGHHWN